MFVCSLVRFTFRSKLVLFKISKLRDELTSFPLLLRIYFIHYTPTPHKNSPQTTLSYHLSPSQTLTQVNHKLIISPPFNKNNKKQNKFHHSYYHFQNGINLNLKIGKLKIIKVLINEFGIMLREDLIVVF